MECESFESQIKQMRAIRIKQEHDEYIKKKLNGEHIYLDFCIWCNAFKKSEGKNDPEVFAEYLKETGTKLTFAQKKHIAETYFGYYGIYDDENEKWTFEKK